MKTKLNDIMKQSRARMCQALLLYGCFFTAPKIFIRKIHTNFLRTV